MAYVESVTSPGDVISVDNTDPVNPVVDYVQGSLVADVTAGAGIIVDNTNPGSPIINLDLTCGGGLSGAGSSASPLFLDFPCDAGDTFSPTLTNITNVTSSTAQNCQWMRVGNIVTLSGKILIEAASAAATELQMTLPVASNFQDDGSVSGTGVCGETNTPIAISGNGTTHKACIKFVATTTTNDSYFFHYTYLIGV